MFRLIPFRISPFVLIGVFVGIVGLAAIGFVGVPFVMRQFEAKKPEPARETSAAWRGTAKWIQGPQSKQTQVDCNFTGNVTLTLRQNGNNLAGDLRITTSSGTPGPNPYTSTPNIVWTPPTCTNGSGGLNGQVQGTVSSSSYRLAMGQSLIITGSFTSDLMRGDFEWCTTPNARSQIQGCSSGGFYKGSFTLSK